MIPRARGLTIVRCAVLICALAATACVHQTVTVHQASVSDAASYNVQLGVAYLQQGNLALAKEKLERAAEENGSDPNVHSALALLYERLGDDHKADSEYRAALRLAPRNPEVSNNYAVFLCRTKRVDEGVRRLLEAAHDPLYRTPEAAYTNAGVCLRAVHHDAEAQANFQRALQIRPNFAEAVYQLGDLEFSQGHTREAKERVQRYLETYNATPELLLLGVRTSRSVGDRVNAERYARRLRVDYPDSEQTRALAELTANPG